ncbi:uncharacterized protein M421DRAFT_7279 [Didymella exigua CBS 183.55]|uniref:DUF7918 domain-containing protein n=1 Tax=Didymella exigua CBS 183.55 TaxID=1150837 RepID=A0A6A5REZ5_9PLEO|nr:uncharacterized protein M421DRAFT_7279 [Didymella exigua CBS 183.55]KAF1926053.1 hypothetical protein M421DRAFT_7279 [Didymella exigua CBS 183.55]
MAIHEDFPGLKVEVIINSKALPENFDEESQVDPDEVVRFVEAEAGAEFAIKWSFDKHFPKSKDIGLNISHSDPSPKQPNPSPGASPLLQQSSVFVISTSADGLTREEMIGLIKQYHGNDDGLASYSTKHLQMLLKFYEDQDTETASCKIKSVFTGHNDGRFKRGREDGAYVTGGRKRSRTEAIVLDD